MRKRRRKREKEKALDEVESLTYVSVQVFGFKKKIKAGLCPSSHFHVDVGTMARPDKK